jgi:hypothetical protein
MHLLAQTSAEGRVGNTWKRTRQRVYVKLPVSVLEDVRRPPEE